jgi:hypothetical protein
VNTGGAVGATVGTGVGTGVAATAGSTNTLGHGKLPLSDGVNTEIECVAGATAELGIVAVMKKTGGPPELKPVPIRVVPSMMTWTVCGTVVCPETVNDSPCRSDVVETLHATGCA